MVDICYFVDEETGSEIRYIGNRDLATKRGISFVVIHVLLM